jgi:geranylgeranyl diphosphate synthase type I
MDAICRYALLPAGKLVRPRLLLSACAAVGGDVDAVMPAAVGAECGHTASLIHDDIIDRDDVRRGRTSVHREFGAADAIVAGDLLIFYLFRCLAECHERGLPAAHVVAALRALADSGMDLCRGQAYEAEVSGDLRCDADAYLQMVKGKTAAFFRGACECGAILGGGTAAQVAALAAYGDDLGVAFQIHDDILCYSSSSEAMGKAASSDVRNHRMTLPVILAYQQGDDSVRADIDAVFAGGLSETEAQRVMAGALRRSGALAWAGQWAKRYVHAAQDRLLVLPPSPSRELLSAVAGLAVNRNA